MRGQMEEEDPDRQDLEILDIWLDEAGEKNYDVQIPTENLTGDIWDASNLLEVSKAWHGALLEPLKRRGEPARDDARWAVDVSPRRAPRNKVPQATSSATGTLYRRMR